MNLESLKAISFDESERYKNAIPILTKVLDEYWNLNAKEKNELLKSIIEKVNYSKTQKNSRNNKERLFELEIFLKI